MCNYSDAVSQIGLKEPYQSIFDFIPLAEIGPNLLQMLLKFDHVYTVVDLRLHFKITFTAIYVETRYGNTTEQVKVARYT